MNDFRYRELLDKERNKDITDLEKKELNLLKEYQKIVDEQVAEQAQAYEDGIYQGAVDGDEAQLAKLEAIKRNQEGDKRVAELREQVAKDARAQQKEEEKNIDETTGAVKTGAIVEKEEKEEKRGK